MPDRASVTTSGGDSRPEDLASELTSHFREKWSGQLLHLAWGVK